MQIAAVYPSAIYLPGLVAEVFDGERSDRRRSVVGVGSPRQLDTRLGDFQHVRPGRSARERGRLGGAMEDDTRVGRSFDDQVSVPRRLTCFAGRLARVQTRVRLT